MTELASQFVQQVRLRREEVPSFDHYPFSLPVVRHLHELALHPKVTYVIGENGSGKSTLLEAMAVSLGFNAEGGSKNFNFGTRASHSELHEYLRISRGYKAPRDGYFLRAESFFNVATNIEELDGGPGGPLIVGSYGGVSLHEQSHGESFMALLTHRFGGQGLYILDEPEAALSPGRQLTALTRIHELVTQGSQFIIATHSPLMMAYPDAWIYQCRNSGLARVAYEETEHFRVTRDFLSHHREVMKAIMAP